MRSFDRRRLMLMIALVVCGVAQGQTLAHKGWAGAGIAVEPWWRGAVLYEIDPLRLRQPGGDGLRNLQGVLRRLDYLQSLGVDALVLSPFRLQAEFGGAGGGAAFDAKYGGEEDLNELVQEASRHRIRLFVDLPLSTGRSTPETLKEARFWLSRGIAGLRLRDEEHSAALSSAQLDERIKALGRLCGTYAGQRVLLRDLPQTSQNEHGDRRRNGSAGAAQVAQMEADPRLAQMPKLVVDDLRRALGRAAHAIPVQTLSVPFSDSKDIARSFNRYADGKHDLQIAKLLATALLTGGGAPLLYSGQEIGMPTSTVTADDTDKDSLLSWYRRLSALHHENAALRTGSVVAIAETNPDVVAWVRDAGSGTTPVVVVCNLTDRELLVPVAAEVRRIGAATGPGMMHTLAASTSRKTDISAQEQDAEHAAEAVSMSAVPLPAYGVYIGELPRLPGLESAPSPLRHGSRGAARSSQ